MSRRPFVFAIVLGALLGASIWIQIVRDRRHTGTIEASLLYIRSGDVMRRIVLSYDALAADLYWIRAIQHYGDTKRTTDPDKRYDLLYPLLDLTTTLDPRFTVAYRFGAIFLAEAYPNGPGRPDQAIALLKHGVQAQPDRWQYLHDIGFVYYWWLRDSRAAAEWFLRASRVPDAPWWLGSLAAVTAAHGGDRAGARFLWRQIYETADHEWLRQNAMLRLVQLDALDEIDRLQVIARQFQRGTGLAVESWAGLIQAGLLPAIPVDPTGTPYQLDPHTGAITVAPSSRLFPLPVESSAAVPPEWGR